MRRTDARKRKAKLIQFFPLQVFVLQELVSALVTPFLLCFSIRYKAIDIVDFFRNFTVEVVGVGDVCSFAQMDVRRHGNPEVINFILAMIFVISTQFCCNEY